MHTDVHLSGEKCRVQFFQEQPFAADLVQRLVQDLVPSGFHGHQFQVCFWQDLPDLCHDQFALYHGKPAGTAADTNFSSHGFKIFLCL